jgi:hypothetical protein
MKHGTWIIKNYPKKLAATVCIWTTLKKIKDTLSPNESLDETSDTNNDNLKCKLLPTMDPHVW